MRDKKTWARYHSDVASDMSYTKWTEEVRWCGCIQKYFDTGCLYGPERFDGPRCTLHGGPQPFRGSREDFLRRQQQLLLDQNKELTHQLEIKQAAEQAAARQQFIMDDLKQTIRRIQEDGRRLQQLLN
jgi:hypothetical protein